MTATTTTALPLPAARIGTQSPGRLAVRRFLRHRMAVASVVLLVLIALAALLLPIAVPHDPNAVDIMALQKPPGDGHLLGTDAAGRDVLARLLAGGQISLLVGLTVAVVATLLGLVLGAVAGYFGGWVDMVIGRITDVVLSFPTLIVVISVVAFVGPSLTTLIVAIGLCEWPTACRIVRGLTLSLRQRDSIQAAVALGASSWHVLRRHIAPEVVAPLTVVATLLVAQAITLEAALSFLGLGVPQPTASWGNMLNAASSLTTLQSMPWLWLPPGIAIAVTILAVNFVGDGLRDAVDPRQSR
ncbi:MAG TPA: oligopeptide ABC transporter permease [Nakamurella sp.]|jgi:peptide/nickel transport system permease protein|nr:oligopeptide ABC transporter permease [Nakamurella sp.]